MPDTTYTLTIALPEEGLLELTLSDASGGVVAHKSLSFQGHVDNALLTCVDNLLKEHSIDRSALSRAHAGRGIDKNSSLYRMVQSFGSAVAVASGSSS